MKEENKERLPNLELKSEDIPVFKSKYRNEMLCWGCSEFGQNGHGPGDTISFVDSQLEFCNNMDIKFMDCGSSHTVIVTGDDQVYSWGNNSSGQLGIGNNQSTFRPVHVSLKIEDRIAGVACGGRHTIIWLTNGHVYSFGNNFYAQLGYDFDNETYKENQNVPHLMKFMLHRPVQQATCGDKHSLFLLQNGTIAAVGCNMNGQIGTGNKHEAVIPRLIDIEQPVKSIASGNNHNLVITDTGTVYMWGYSRACGQRRQDILSPKKVNIKHEVIQVACGSSHSMALTVNGNIYVWGSGTDGQLGFKDVLFQERPKQLKIKELKNNTAYIASGDGFSAALTVSGQLYMWGKSSDTINCNQNTNYKQHVPVCINQDGISINSIKCGGWHAVAVTGTPVSCINKCNEDEEDDDDNDDDDIDTPSDMISTNKSDLSSKTDSICHQNTLDQDKNNNLPITDKITVQVSLPPEDTFILTPTPRSGKQSSKESSNLKNSGTSNHSLLAEKFKSTEDKSKEDLKHKDRSPGHPNASQSRVVHYLVEFDPSKIDCPLPSGSSMVPYSGQPKQTNQKQCFLVSHVIDAKKPLVNEEAIDITTKITPHSRTLNVPSERSTKPDITTKDKSQISVDFKPPDKGNLYKRQALVAQNDFKLRKMDELRLNKVFEDLFKEAGSSSKVRIPDDQRKELKLLFDSMTTAQKTDISNVPKNTDKISSNKLQSSKTTRQNPKPLLNLRQKSDINIPTTKTQIKRSAVSANGGKPSTNSSKPVFSSASSWRRRDVVPLLGIGKAAPNLDKKLFKSMRNKELPVVSN